MNFEVNTIECGEAGVVLKDFPVESINCCISSPPYWALRDYGVVGQLGLEPTFEEYIDKLCNIYDEVWRVLRKDGTCWVNLGDTYGTHTSKRSGQFGSDMSKDINAVFANKRPNVGLEKSLCLIPQRFAIEMVNRGWILRNVCVWHKPNPMPSSAKDRFTVDFEYVFFFVKSKKYWFEPQYEPYSPNSDMEYRKTLRLGKFYRAGNQNPYKDNTPLAGDRKMTPMTEGRNKRTVWTIPTQAYSEAHFATFPEKLVEPMIKAGCPEFVCKKCGAGRRKVYETVFIKDGNSKANKVLDAEKSGDRYNATVMRQGHGNNEHHFKGYTDCGCNAGWRSGIVLDPFCWLWHCRQGRCPVAA